MTQLLVIVPALLANYKRVVDDLLTLTDPAHVVPLHTKLGRTSATRRLIRTVKSPRKMHSS
jgi:hypothetical protein